MNRYFVQLIWPKATGNPTYCAELDAESKDEAKQLAEEMARRDGFAGAPKQRIAREIAKEVAA